MSNLFVIFGSGGFLTVVFSGLGRAEYSYFILNTVFSMPYPTALRTKGWRRDAGTLRLRLLLLPGRFINHFQFFGGDIREAFGGVLK